MMWMIGILITLVSSWSADDYDRHDHESFFKRQDVHQLIDLKNPDLRLLEAAIFYASNEIRIEHDLPVFNYGEAIEVAARKHSEDMLRLKFIDHINKRDRKNKTPIQRVENAGGDYNGIRENLALVNVLQLSKDGGFMISPAGELVNKEGEPLRAYSYAALARRAVNNWMNSPGHRENLLSDHNWLGCGVSDISYGKHGMPQVHLTQNFGKK